MTHFLNVDLELVARIDFGRLLSHLARSTVTLRDSVDDGRRTVWLELAGGNPPDPSGAILQYATLVQSLPRRTRSLWDACDDRCLNVGIQSGLTPHAAGFPISLAAIAALLDIAARLEFTVYGATPP